MMKILLVDDESGIKKTVSSLLFEAGYAFVYADNGFDALRIAESERPDLIIMDVMMPKMDGFTACRKIRELGITAPIIFLSAKGDIVDKGIGFDAGGDDYIVKPFDPRELLMHIEAQLRRANMSRTADIFSDDEAYQVGPFKFEPGQFCLSLEQERIPLTPKETKILYMLVSNPGTVLSKEQLIEAAWGKEYIANSSSLTVFIKKLREKVETDPSDPKIIQTVWGIGYRFES